MEHNRARVNYGSNGSWPKYEVIEHLSIREQVAILMESALVRFQSANMSAATIAAFKSDWADELRQVGTQRFLTGLQQACRSTTFFPLVSEILKRIPPAQPLPQYSGPTAEDLRRTAAGERSYGVPDVRVLSKLHQTLHDKVERPLFEEEIEGLLVDLDNMIDFREGATR